MATIKTYKDIDIEVVSATKDPAAVVKLACDMTMKKQPEYNSESLDTKLLKFLITAEHSSVLEHASITMLIKGISRSLLAQLSRHRMASITSQSQHYQKYTDAPMVVSPTVVGNDDFVEAFDMSLRSYQEMLDNGMPREEARQVLPTAAAVNILWTVNVRGLMSFLRPRLCWRNVEEMKVFADKVYDVCMEWWPECFQFIGPPCKLEKCNQGPMKDPRCGNGKEYPGALYED